eukprot:COSAG04_NODE_1503_length_6511_cov_1.877573_9_plen_221_part_00
MRVQTCVVCERWQEERHSLSVRSERPAPTSCTAGGCSVFFGMAILKLLLALAHATAAAAAVASGRGSKPHILMVVVDGAAPLAALLRPPRGGRLEAARRVVSSVERSLLTGLAQTSAGTTWAGTTPTCSRRTATSSSPRASSSTGTTSTCVSEPRGAPRLLPSLREAAAHRLLAHALRLPLRPLPLPRQPDHPLERRRRAGLGRAEGDDDAAGEDEGGGV